MSRRLLMPILAAVAGACLLGLLVYGVTTKATHSTLDEQVARGEDPLAPGATHLLPVLDGHGRSSLAALRGKVVVLNFWASWCVPCETEAPELQKAQATLAQHDGTVLGVTYEDVSSDSSEFIHSHHLTYPNLRDDGGEFARSYGTDEVPESFVINRQGRIVAISRGQIDGAFLAKALALAKRV